MRPETVCYLIFFKISENRLNGFENGNSTAVEKKKKWSIPLRYLNSYFKFREMFTLIQFDMYTMQIVIYMQCKHLSMQIYSNEIILMLL